jgi:uncharacterized protein (TIGR00255 family)
MTGFGSASAVSAGFRVDVDMRSVNGRYLSLKVRIPSEYASLEEEVRAILGPRLIRGNVEVRVDISREKSKTALQIDKERLAAYLKQWRSLAREFKLDGDLRVENLAATPELFAPVQDKSRVPKALRALKKAMDEACQIFNNMRSREGANLKKSLLKHSVVIDRLRARIERRAPKVAGLLGERVLARVKRVLAKLDSADEIRAADITREVAWLAEKTDVAEEMDRLSSHLQQFEGALEKGGQVGKRLDFLVQEMHREANTTGSKGSDTELSQLVVEMKLQIEKLREQVQNLL